MPNIQYSKGFWVVIHSYMEVKFLNNCYCCRDTLSQSKIWIHSLLTHFHRKGFNLAKWKYKTWRKYSVKENLCLIISTIFLSSYWVWLQHYPPGWGHLIAYSQGPAPKCYYLPKNNAAAPWNFISLTDWKPPVFFTNRLNNTPLLLFCGNALTYQFLRALPHRGMPKLMEDKGPTEVLETPTQASCWKHSLKLCLHSNSFPLPTPFYQQMRMWKN